MNNLANSYAPSAGTPRPSSSAKRRWRLRKAKLGPDHPDTLESMSNLADSYDALAGTPRPSSSTKRRWP